MTGSADLPDQIASAVLATPGVSDLHAGVVGEVATYLPGRRVNGVRVHDQDCEIHLVLDGRRPIGDTVRAVRGAVRRLLPGTIDVTVEDIGVPAASGP